MNRTRKQRAVSTATSHETGWPDRHRAPESGTENLQLAVRDRFGPSLSGTRAPLQGCISERWEKMDDR